MNLHTPGPWQVELHGSGAHLIRGADGLGVAVVTGNAANAHLIAAAPHLLAVAEEIAGDPRVDLVDSERRIRLYASIAIARGEIT